MSHDLSRSTFPFGDATIAYDADGFLIPQDCPECGAIASVERGDAWWKCGSCYFLWVDSDDAIATPPLDYLVAEFGTQGAGEFLVEELGLGRTSQPSSDGELVPDPDVPF